MPTGRDSSGDGHANAVAFADAILQYGQDMSHGRLSFVQLPYDALSPAVAAVRDTTLVKRLAAVASVQDWQACLHSWEPATAAFQLFKSALILQIKAGDARKVSALRLSMNYSRWIHYLSLTRYILVNITAANLSCLQDDSCWLRMKTVAGKPKTPTPRMGAYCTELILYPYWNVPRKIAVQEMLPLIKKTPGLIDDMNMQVLDNHGKVIDHHQVNWLAYNKDNFPFRFRQSTGCDNALGVIKFNISNPFDVYLHDTNLRSAFQSDYRYYSHGCVRIEKPIELAEYLLGNGLDTVRLQSCLKDQKPASIALERPVPVLMLYMPVDISDDQSLQYYPDIYHLLP